jgi:hypothetical protein
VCPSANISSQRCALFEHSHWHHRFLCKTLLDEPKENQTGSADDNGGNDVSCVPIVKNTSGGETEEEGGCTTDKDNDTEDINSLEFLFESRCIGFESEEEPDSNDNDDNDGNVDIKDPEMSMKREAVYHLQVVFSAIAPPMIGPMTVPRAHDNATIPANAPRSFNPTISVTVTSTNAIIPPPPIP